MSEFNSQVYTESQDGLRAYILKVFSRMGWGLLITAGVAYLFNVLLSTGSEAAAGVYMIFAMVCLVAELIIAFTLSLRLNKMSLQTATVLFYAYAAVTGVSFAAIFTIYTSSEIFISFLFTAVLFFSCVAIGHTTKVDLSKFAGIMLGGLITLLILSVAAWFIPALRNSLLVSYIGVILFCALTAWDMQKIKSYYYGLSGDEVMRSKMSIMSAFQLYLDFINLFLYVLRIVSNSRNRN